MNFNNSVNIVWSMFCLHSWKVVGVCISNEYVHKPSTSPNTPQVIPSSYLHHSGGQTSSLQLPSPLPSADACQRVINWIKVPAILECVFSGKLISKLISHTSEAGSDSTNCDKGVFKSNRLPPLSLKQVNTF
jgi:hypothetical protein